MTLSLIFRDIFGFLWDARAPPANPNSRNTLRMHFRGSPGLHSNRIQEAYSPAIQDSRDPGIPEFWKPPESSDKKKKLPWNTGIWWLRPFFFFKKKRKDHEPRIPARNVGIPGLQNSGNHQRVTKSEPIRNAEGIGNTGQYLRNTRESLKKYCRILFNPRK